MIILLDQLYIQNVSCNFLTTEYLFRYIAAIVECVGLEFINAQNALTALDQYALENKENSENYVEYKL